MRWIWVVLLMGCVVSVQADTVWRWVDDQGVVHYSDRHRPGAEKMSVGPAQTYTPPAVPQRPVKEPPPEPEAPPPYTSLRVVTPVQGETVWNIASELPVQVDVQPALAAGHELRVFHNGRRVETPKGATQFTVSEVYRGEHSLRVTIVDGRGREMASSETVNFFVHQASLLFPARQGPARAGGG